MHWISMSCSIMILLASLPASARAEEGRKWAILIGVNEYLDPAIPDLKYCVADARRLFDTLTRLGDFQPERVLLLVDDQPKAHLRPLRLNLMRQIEGWLANCGPEDTVIIAFSGHGFVDELTGEGFLAPADCELDNLRASSLPTERLRQILRDCRAGKKLLILDCCFAGAERSGEPTGASGEELSRAFTQAQGLITLASGLTDTSGRAQLPVTLSLSQQSQGTFAVAVRRGDTSRSYTLERFPQSRSYALYVPRATAPSSPPSAPQNPASPRPGTTMENSIGIKLAWIPAGEFLMGSADNDRDAYGDEKPRHTVRITKPYYLGVTEVTQQQYQRVMGVNPSHFQGAQLPVEQVSWEEAVEFCRRLSALPEERAAGRVYRLPTEAEWEYACRAGSNGKWSFGDDESGLSDYAWYRENSGETTHPVGQKRPNAWGLYDMHGNVWEWCADWYGGYTSNTADDPLGPATGPDRVSRGGSWNIHPRACRSAYRGRILSEPLLLYLGFRVAFSSVDQSGGE